MQKRPFFRKSRVEAFSPPPVGSAFHPSALVGKSTPRFLLWNHSLSQSAKAVYGALLWRADAQGVAFPSLAYIAHDIGSGTTAVEDAVSALVKAGWIRRTRGARRPDGTRGVNRYEFLWSRHWQDAWIYQQLLIEKKGRTGTGVQVYERLVDHPQPGSVIAREEALTWRRHKNRKPDPVIEKGEPKTGDGPTPENVKKDFLPNEPAVAAILSEWTSRPYAMAPTKSDRDAIEAVLKKYPPKRVANVIDYYLDRVWTDGKKILGEAVSESTIESYHEAWLVASVIDLKLSGDDLLHPERFGRWWSKLKKTRLKKGDAAGVSA